MPPQLTTDTQCRQGVREVPDPAPGTLLAAGEAGLLFCYCETLQPGEAAEVPQNLRGHLRTVCNTQTHIQTGATTAARPAGMEWAQLH